MTCHRVLADDFSGRHLPNLAWAKNVACATKLARLHCSFHVHYSNCSLIPYHRSRICSRSLRLGRLRRSFGGFLSRPIVLCATALERNEGDRWWQYSSDLWATFFGYGSRDLIGDFVLSRRYVECTVEKIDENSGRSGRYYHVYINDRHYLTIANVFTKLQKGGRIRAEIGAGSETIFDVTPLQH
jgi:hypothetical protein